MLAETEFRPRFRESRVYGYEIKHGPRGLETTIARSEGVKNVEILTGPGNLGNVFMQAQKRMNAGPQQKLHISVWVSLPFVFTNPSDTNASLLEHKAKFLRVHRALRRLIRTKAYQFFEGQNHGA
jgi:hypothetical protein